MQTSKYKDIYIGKRLIRIFIFLPIILFLSLSNHLVAQRDIINSKNFYDQINASTVIKKKNDFNLKGNVKSIIEISLSSNDSIYLDFNSNGLLTKQLVSSTKELTLYSFEGNQLKYIYFEKPNYNYISEKYFGSSGYLEKEIIDKTNPSDTSHIESAYTYNKNFNELNISYKYSIDISRRDVVLHDSYVFTLNNKNQLIKERNLSRHKETTYGNTATYFYDSISKNLIGWTYIDDCALTGSNSCLNLSSSITYDNRNNIISKSLSDATVRNSTWSYGSGYSAKYNENNDIIEEYHSEGGSVDFRYLLLPQKKAKNNKVINTTTNIQKRTFDYDYDTNGNWIKKYEIKNNNRTLIKSRIIEYYN